MNSPVITDQILGCLLGGALGDAIGSCFEGRERIGNLDVPQKLQCSDDTQLTVATCEAILEFGSVEPESIARHFVTWFRSGRISGIGASTLKAFTELEAGGHWATVGASGERAAGNGAAMRIAPLAFLLDPDSDSERQTIRDVCRITHRNEEAYVGALAVVRSIRYIIAGNELNTDLIESLIADLPDSRVRDRLIAIDQTSMSVVQYASVFATSGYVVDSVPLAILAATRSEDILDSILQVASLGGDTDTIGSIYGQIFGAAFGIDRMPEEMLDRIDAISLIGETSKEFGSLVSHAIAESTNADTAN